MIHNCVVANIKPILDKAAKDSINLSLKMSIPYDSERWLYKTDGIFTIIWVEDED